VLLAFVVGHRGAVLLGDDLGESLAKLTGPSRRRTKDLYGVPRARAEGLGHDAPALGPAPHPSPGAPLSEHEPQKAEAPIRTRGVFVPASVVLAYAKRGAIPAVDTANGVVLRGVGTGTGLEDGDVVVRVGRAPVRSLREITGIVQASLFAGHTELSGTIRRGDVEIAVTVEVPTGGDAGP